jgi:hypothetical protein
VLEVIGVALIGALALEIIALLMSSAGSRLVLFGFGHRSVRALLPTLFIGAAVRFHGQEAGKAAQKAAKHSSIVRGKKSVRRRQLGDMRSRGMRVFIIVLAAIGTLYRISAVAAVPIQAPSIAVTVDGPRCRSSHFDRLLSIAGP